MHKLVFDILNRIICRFWMLLLYAGKDIGLGASIVLSWKAKQQQSAIKRKLKPFTIAVSASLHHFQTRSTDALFSLR